MTREQLIELHSFLSAKALDLMTRKNQDYAGGGDPFSNFRASSVLGIDPVLALMVRCIDKFKRIESFVRKGELKVKEESVQDSILDVINYMVLLAGLLEERNDPQSMKGVGVPVPCDAYGKIGEPR